MKVSKKVGRRSRKHTSSVSRRRLRSKKSRSGYKKKHTKTQRGGARSRKYGHKRGRRFHRGGVLGGDVPNDIDDRVAIEVENLDSESTRDPKLTTSDIPSLLVTNANALPDDIFRARARATKIDNALYFEYERTDGRRHKLGKMLGVGQPVRGLFDVVILWAGEDSQVSHIFLLRRIKNKNDKDEYDKKFIIDYQQFVNHFSDENDINKPFTGIQGYSINSRNLDNRNLTNYMLPKNIPATYTLPATDNNNKNLSFIRHNILSGLDAPHTRNFFPEDI